MTKSQPKAKLQKPPHPGDLMMVIRSLAADGKISYSRHALERLDERDNCGDIMDVTKLLRNGEIDGEIKPGARAGEWDCLVMGKFSLEGREAGVSTIVVRGERLIIKTVEWMDP